MRLTCFFINDFKKNININMKDKIIAIPLENGMLCSHFGHCQAFSIVKVKDGKITESNEVIPPEHIPGLYPRWVARFGVSDVIAGGMGQQAIELFKQQGINVFIGNKKVIFNHMIIIVQIAQIVKLTQRVYSLSITSRAREKYARLPTELGR